MKKVVMLVMVVVMLVSAVEIFGTAPVTFLRLSDNVELNAEMELAYTEGTGRQPGSFIIQYYLGRGADRSHMTGFGVDKAYLTSVINTPILARGRTAHFTVREEPSLAVAENYRITMMGDVVYHQIAPNTNDNGYACSFITSSLLKKQGAMAAFIPAQFNDIKDLMQKGIDHQAQVMRNKNVAGY